MECAKRKNKVNFDDKGKNYFFLDSQKFTFYHLFISKAQKREKSRSRKLTHLFWKAWPEVVEG